MTTWRIIIICLLIITLLSILPACSASSRMAEGIFFTEIDSERIESESIESESIILGSSPLLIPAYGEIYQTAFEVIECDVADTYYVIDGPTIDQGLMLGFENNGFGRMTYTDITPDRRCLVSTAVTISVPADDRPATVSAKIYKSGVADDASFIGEYISDADPADALPVMCLMQLQPNDFIEIYVASNTANTTVVINSMTFVATTVD